LQFDAADFRKLNCITKEVGEYLIETRRIAEAAIRHIVCHMIGEAQVFLLCQRRKQGDQALDDCVYGEWDLLEGELTCFNL